MVVIFFLLIHYNYSSLFTTFHHNFNLINIVFEFPSVNTNRNNSDFMRTKFSLSKQYKQQLLDCYVVFTLEVRLLVK